MHITRRTSEGRRHKHPDIFLSHSSRDKNVVRKLAEDLTFCQVDSWLDEWELGVGDSLHDSIGNALENSRFIGIVLADNFSDSRWANDELKQALSRERRSDAPIVLPLLFGKCDPPPFLEDKVYIDFRRDYFGATTRLAAAVHGVSRLRVEEAIGKINPSSVGAVINALRYCGVEPYIVLGEDDFQEIVKVMGSTVTGDELRFDPERVRSSNVSLRIRNLMDTLINDVWKDLDPVYVPSIEMDFNTPQRIGQQRLSQNPCPPGK